MSTRKELRKERKEKVLALLKEYEDYRTESSEYVLDLPNYLRYTMMDRISAFLAIACGSLTSVAWAVAGFSPVICLALGLIIGWVQFSVFVKDRDGKRLPFSDRWATKKLKKVIARMTEQLEWIDREWPTNPVYEQLHMLMNFIIDEHLGEARFVLCDDACDRRLYLDVQLEDWSESLYIAPETGEYAKLHDAVAKLWYQKDHLAEVLREFDTRLHAGI